MRIALNKLKIDDKLTRMRPVNRYFVSRYRQAYRAGKDLGDIIVEKGTNRVVSGNHRVTALREEYGDEHVIDVVARSFQDEKELLETFARENSHHGNALTGISRSMLTAELLKAGSTPEDVAQIFGISVKRVQQLGGHVVAVIGKRGKTEYKPVKANIEPNSEMSEPDYQVHIRADLGVETRKLIGQIERAIGRGVKDEETIMRLVELAQLIDETFGSKAVAS